jgi:hypothetical protein
MIQMRGDLAGAKDVVTDLARAAPVASSTWAELA